MNNIVYEGVFKDHIKNYIELKQAAGYKCITEEVRLKQFDKWISEKYPDALILTKEIILDWCGKKEYEAQANQNLRTTIVRQFGKYLDSIGVKAYIVPERYYLHAKQYVPYIYTDDELAKFFLETDKNQYCSICPHRHQIMPVIFRMIYMCGLRASEARLLKVADIDLKEGVLTIRHSKEDNDRLVPMSTQLVERCLNFSKQVHLHPTPEDYYFPALDGKPITLGNLYLNFRRFLWRAKIPHRGRGFGPRIHDMRHCYAINCLKKWVKQEKDLMVYLPVLRTYMGHNSFAETAYYLRLTADVFPDIALKIETKYPSIIPELEGDAYEAY